MRDFDLGGFAAHLGKLAADIAALEHDLLRRALRDLNPIGSAQAQQVIIKSHGDRHVADPEAARIEILQNLPPFDMIGGDFSGITPNYIYRVFVFPNGDLSIGTYYDR